MAERFQKLFSLEPNRYTKECPIIIEAGALQKDTETGNVIAQIKMRNIGDAPIASCKISLRAFENNGDELEGISDYSYLDLNAGRGCEFGTKVPVLLPDKTSRSFSVDISEIVFTDGTVKKLDNNQWTSIPDQQPVEAVLTDTALAQQYKIEAGGSADLLPEKKDGFFLCTCGAVNYDTAETCYKCGNSYENLCAYMDKEYLVQKIEERNEKRRIEQEKKEEKKKLYIKIGAAAVAVLILFGIINAIHQKLEEKKEAEIRASLAGKSYTAVVSGWGERHCDFNNDGTVHEYSFANSGKNWGDSEYIYEVRKLSDGNNGLDFAFSEDSLFYNGEYDYVVTDIQNNQITEFTDTDEFAGYDVYKLDSPEETKTSSGVNTDDDAETGSSSAESEYGEIIITKGNKESRKAEAYETVEVGDFIFSVPTFFTDDPGDAGDATYYAARGTQIVMLQFNVTDLNNTDFENKDQRDVTAKAIIDGMMESGDFSQNGDYHVFKTGTGFIGISIPFRFSFTRDDGVAVDQFGDAVYIQNPKNKNIIEVSLFQSEEAQYDYSDAFKKIIESAKLKND